MKFRAVLLLAFRIGKADKSAEVAHFEILLRQKRGDLDNVDYKPAWEYDFQRKELSMVFVDKTVYVHSDSEKLYLNHVCECVFQIAVGDEQKENGGVS